MSSAVRLLHPPLQIVTGSFYHLFCQFAGSDIDRRADHHVTRSDRCGDQELPYRTFTGSKGEFKVPDFPWRSRTCRINRSAAFFTIYNEGQVCTGEFHTSVPEHLRAFPVYFGEEQGIQIEGKYPGREFSKIPRYFRSSSRSPPANDDVTTPMVTKITNHAVEIATSFGLKPLYV